MTAPFSHIDGVTWRDVEPTFRHRLEQTVLNDPRVLLEVDGGPVGMKADIILATLYGLDEQVDAEWRIPRVESELLMPLMQRWRSIATPDPAEPPMLRTARYVLQSSYAMLDLSPTSVPLPADVKIGPPDFLASVLWVRYKRKV